MRVEATAEIDRTCPRGICARPLPESSLTVQELRPAWKAVHGAFALMGRVRDGYELDNGDSRLASGSSLRT